MKTKCPHCGKMHLMDGDKWHYLRHWIQASYLVNAPPDDFRYERIVVNGHSVDRCIWPNREKYEAWIQNRGW